MKTLLHPSFLSQLKGWFSPRSPDDVRICDHTVITEQQPSCSHGNDQFGKLHTKLKRWHGFCLSLFTSKPLTFHFLLALFGTRQHLQFCQKLNNEHFYFNYFLINKLLFGLVTFHAGWRILSSVFFFLLLRCKMLLQYSQFPWMRGGMWSIIHPCSFQRTEQHQAMWISHHSTFPGLHQKMPDSWGSSQTSLNRNTHPASSQHN